MKKVLENFALSKTSFSKNLMETSFLNGSSTSFSETFSNISFIRIYLKLRFYELFGNVVSKNLCLLNVFLRLSFLNLSLDKRRFYEKSWYSRKKFVSTKEPS